VRKIYLFTVFTAVLCLLLFGGMQYASPLSGELLPVLMYHDLCPDSETPGRYAVTESRFREDMQWLKENGYTPMVASDLIAAYAARKLPEKPIMITFDDGYMSNYTIAYPILEETDMKATVCVIGTLLDESRTGYMGWKEAEILQKSGVIDIQSHTYDLHYEGEGSNKWPSYGRGVNRFGDETKAAYAMRFGEDTDTIARRLSDIGGKLLLYAYPYGICDEWSISVLKNAGVQVTLLTGNQLHTLHSGLYGITRMEVTMERSVTDIFSQSAK